MASMGREKLGRQIGKGSKKEKRTFHSQNLVDFRKALPLEKEKEKR